MPANRNRLADLEPGANFIPRHIGPGETEIGDMLKLLGAASLEEFIGRAIPAKIRQAKRGALLATQGSRGVRRG